MLKCSIGRRWSRQGKPPCRQPRPQPRSLAPHRPIRHHRRPLPSTLCQAPAPRQAQAPRLHRRPLAPKRCTQIIMVAWSDKFLVSMPRSSPRRTTPMLVRLQLPDQRVHGCIHRVLVLHLSFEPTVNDTIVDVDGRERGPKNHMQMKIETCLEDLALASYLPRLTSEATQKHFLSWANSRKPRLKNLSPWVETRSSSRTSSRGV